MFSPYNGLVLEVQRRMRADRIRRNDRMVEDLIVETGAELLLRQGGSSNVVTPAILENVHYFLSHRVLYVSSALAKELEQTKVDVPPDELTLPYTLFEVCFDEGLEVRPGLRIPSALVLIKPDDATFGAMKSRFQRMSDVACSKVNSMRRDAGLPELPAQEAEITGKLRQSFYLLFRLKDGDGQTCQLHMPIDKYKGVRTDEAIDDLLSGGPIAGLEPLSPEEVEVEHALCRIVFGAICYLNIKNPECEAWKDRHRPSVGVRPNGLILGRTMRASPGRHMRKGNMHALVHPRFHGGEEGKVRYVWVRPCEVNQYADSAGNAPKVEEIDPI